MSDDDGSIERGVLSSEEASYPLIASALKQSDCKAWLSAHGFDAEAVRSRLGETG